VSGRMVFPASVTPEGRLVMDLKAWGRCVESHRGKRVLLTLEREGAQRSLRALRHYFGVVVPAYMRESKLDKDQSHHVLKDEILGYWVEDAAGNSRRIVPETRNMTSDKFAAFVDAAILRLAENGINVPEVPS
jgi:hypothetical protein